jgi:glyoxylate reductase
MNNPERPTIVSTMRCPEPIIEEFLKDLVVIQGPKRSVWGKADILARAPEATAIITRGGAHERIDEELILHMPNLQIVANAALGYDNFAIAALEKHGVWGTNEPKAFTTPTAEITLGLVLDVLRRLPESERFVRAGKWSAYAPGLFDGESIENKTIGLVGFGSIGQAVAKRLQGFDVEVLYYARKRRPAAVEAALHARYAPLDALLAQSHIVSMHVPLTDETRGMVNREFLGKMRAGAFFINTTRGAVVDEAALVRALQSGRIAGAGLDVFANEPHIPQELLGMENVVLYPHIGGGTLQARTSSMRNAARNVRLVLAGKRPLSPVAIPSSPRPRISFKSAL